MGRSTSGRPRRRPGGPKIKGYSSEAGAGEDDLFDGPSEFTCYAPTTFYRDKYETVFGATTITLPAGTAPSPTAQRSG